MSTIAVMGQGKVGLTLSACLVEAGYRVFGIDVDAAHIGRLAGGSFSTDEPGVLERLRHHAGRFIATTDATRAIAESDVTFVVVPTPSNTLGGFSLRHVKAACQEIGAALRGASRDHVIAVTSTVLPGSSDYFIIPHLERVIGRTLGDGWGYVYNPAFIALGEVVQGFVKPDYILIGESDSKSGQALVEIHRSIVLNHASVARMSLIEAEIAKIASNTHETMRVSFANMLCSLCSEIPGANVDRITEALAHRMGKRFFKGAVPYGGPCWPRDNVALASFMNILGVPSTIPATVDQFNQEYARYVLRKCLEVAKPGEAVAVLGLAYKAGTAVIERAFGVELAQWLAAEGRQVMVWDPLAMEPARAVLQDRVGYAVSLEACLQQARVVILVNTLRELERVEWSSLGERVLVDCWRCVPPQAIARIAHYVPLGQGTGRNGAARLSPLHLERLRLLTD